MMKQTPGLKLWWEFKCKNMDCVLLFKVWRRLVYGQSLSVAFLWSALVCVVLSPLAWCDAMRVPCRLVRDASTGSGCVCLLLLAYNCLCIFDLGGSGRQVLRDVPHGR